VGVKVWLDGFVVVVLMDMCGALYFWLVLWALGLVGCGYLVRFVYLMGECKSASWFLLFVRCKC
jgi:hypothetical protein